MALTWAVSTDAKAADIEGVFDKVDDQQIEYWLNRAKRAILSAVPDLDSRVASRRVAEDVPADVQVDLVIAKFGNPGGIRTAQETNGPTSNSVTYGGDNPGSLELTKQQLRDLMGAAKPKGRAGTISMVPNRPGWYS